MPTVHAIPTRLAADQPRATQSAALGAEPYITKAKIFVVEDEPTLSRAVQRTLNSVGDAVAGAATSGESALETIGTVMPDLVRPDIQLAGELDGVATAERQRAGALKAVAHRHDRVAEDGTPRGQSAQERETPGQAHHARATAATGDVQRLFRRPLCFLILT